MNSCYTNITGALLLFLVCQGPNLGTDKPSSQKPSTQESKTPERPECHVRLGHAFPTWSPRGRARGVGRPTCCQVTQKRQEQEAECTSLSSECVQRLTGLSLAVLVSFPWQSFPRQCRGQRFDTQRALAVLEHRQVLPQRRSPLTRGSPLCLQ